MTIRHSFRNRARRDRRKALLSAGGGEPAFVSAEIGTVNGYTVVVTFDQEVTEAPAVTIKENGVATTNDGGTIQGDAHIVRYVIPIPWHGSDDVITVDDNVVTNNMDWVSLPDSQADTGASPSAWLDQSIHGRDFTQSDSGARPVVTTRGGKAIVIPDGTDDWMNGEIFADDLENFTIIAVMSRPDGSGATVISKLDVDIDWLYNGWQMANDGSFVIYQNPNAEDYRQQSLQVLTSPNPLFQNNVYTVEKIGNDATAWHLYLNGALNDGSNNNQGDPITSFANSETVKLWVDGGVNGPDNDGYSVARLSALMMFVPCPPAADRAALEMRVGLRYAEAPEYISGAINTVLTVEFSTGVNSSNFAAGSTIKVNDVEKAILSAEIGFTTNQIVFTLDLEGVGGGDIITYEYSGGNIVSTLHGIPLGTVTPQIVTNNI